MRRLALLLLLLLLAPAVHAQQIRQQSTNYRIPTDVVSSGGGESAKSTNYVLDDTLGEPNIGFGRSTTFDLNAGYRQTVSDAFVSLACDDTVSLGTITFSGQANGTGTCTVTTDADAGYALQWRSGTNNQNGLVGHWKLDEPTGTTAYDSSGYNTNGSHQNTPTISTDIPSNYFSTRSLEFDGVSESVTFSGAYPQLHMTDNLTLAGWIYPRTNASGTFGSMINLAQEGTSIENYDILITNGTTSPKLWFQYNNGGWQQVAVDNALTLNTWQHVAVTFEGGTITLYLNGKILRQESGKPLMVVDYENDLKISRYQVGSQGYFNGRFDDIRVYNRVLNQAEVRDLASKAPPGSLVMSGSQVTSIAPFLMPFTGGLIGYWKMDEIPVGTLADSSGFGRDGTSDGATGANNKPQPSTDVPSANFVTHRSLDFDGTDDHATVAGAPFNFGTSDFTVSYWVKTTTADRRVLGHFNITPNRGWGSYLYPTTINFFAYGDLGTLDAQKSFTAVDGEWHHIAGVYTRSGDSLTIEFFADGESLGTSTGTVGDISKTTDLLLGTYIGATTTLDGQLDNVRIYDRALADSEVTALHGTPQTWSTPATASYWGGRLSSTSTDTDSKWGTDSSSEKWLNVGDGNYVIVSRSSRTSVAGSTEVFRFRTEVGAQKIQTAGVYTAAVVFTASSL